MSKTPEQKAAIRHAKEAAFAAKPLSDLLPANRSGGKQGDADRLRAAVHKYLSAVETANGDFDAADAATAAVPKPQPSNTL
jgi:hypothetical protein